MPERLTSRWLLRGPRGVPFFGGIVLGLILVAAVASSAAAADDEWEIDGGGWGHGIGLSQYGAFGMALDGFSSPEILAHYYSGSQIRKVEDLLGSSHWINGDEALWVGLRSQQNLTRLDITALGGNVSVCQPGNGTDDCSTAAAVIKPGAAWRFEKVSGGCRLRQASTSTVLPTGDCSADVTWTDNTDLNNLAGTTRVSVGGRSYSHGTLRLRPNTRNTGFHASLSISLENYIRGIAEMPSSWHTTALGVQATIARSYGVAQATSRSSSGEISSARRTSCWCHLWATSSDQNYSGWQKEAEGSDARYGKRWVSASKATKGNVLVHPSDTGTIIRTFYSSSSGGATENNEDVWGGTPLPYLRSRPDPWSLPPFVNNPFATWTKTVSDAAVHTALGWDSVTDAVLIAGPPGTVVRFTGTDNGTRVTAEKSGNWFRAVFSVRSPYVSAIRQLLATWDGRFRDDDGSVHEPNIESIAALGVTKGCNPPDNNRFCPDASVTRGQMAAFLVRALGLPGGGDDRFRDDDGSVFERDIERLAAAGITKGCNPPTNDRFCPNDTVTRGQMAAFLVRAFGYRDTGGGNHFRDDDGSTFETDIDRLATAGITKGCNPPTNDRFCPTEPVSRAQMASFLARALGS